MTPALLTLVTRSPPQLVLRHASAHTSRHHSRQHGPGVGNKLDFSENQNKSPETGIIRAGVDTLQERLGLGILQDEQYQDQTTLHPDQVLRRTQLYLRAGG